MTKRKRPDVAESSWQGTDRTGLLDSLNRMVLQHLEVHGVSTTFVESLQTHLTGNTAGSRCQNESELLKVFRYAMEGKLALMFYKLSGVSQEFEIDTRSTTTVYDLKCCLETSLGISAHEQQLIVDNNVLHDVQPLVSCGFTPCKRAVQVMQKRRQFAISGCGAKLQCWDLENGECYRVLDGHDGTVSHVFVDWPSMRLLSADDNGTIKFWNLKNGTCIRTMEVHSEDDSGEATLSGIMMGDCATLRAISASYDTSNTIKVWDVDSGKCMRKLQGHDDTVNQIIADWQSQRALSVSDDATIRLWNFEEGTCIHVLFDCGTQVSVDWASMQLLHNGADNGVAQAEVNNVIKLWSLKKGECLLHVLEGHVEGVNNIVADWPSMRALSASEDNTMKLWDLQSGKCVSMIDVDADRPETLVVDWPSMRAVSVSDDRIKVWNLKQGVVHSSLACPNNITIAADGPLRRAIVATVEETDDWACKCSIELWNLDDMKCIRTINGAHDDVVSSMKVDWPTMRVLTAAGDNIIKLWSLDNGECLKSFKYSSWDEDESVDLFACNWQ
eukprot:gnl/MRDRNA2_/MRDRNA2_107429_c0_seq1.p1 gnl/MRDRNA2_/MRDRNA2_107429_c0~~gnl/MRDRNA2_/MRDRNA2_107429_c0_seq1.p1  ORF type:complete len:557 (+),score=80.26 gnl/MRDRNA2_/MRDRNA2_107429_c0_seq1:71-1741(+)